MKDTMDDRLAEWELDYLVLIFWFLKRVFDAKLSPKTSISEYLHEISTSFSG